MGRMGRLSEEESIDKRTQFGIWLGLPYAARADDEKTQKDFCRKLDITPDTARAWSEDKYVQEVAENALIVFGGNEKLKIVQKLIEQASKGDIRSIELYFKWQNMLGQNMGLRPKVKAKHVTKRS